MTKKSLRHNVGAKSFWCKIVLVQKCNGPKTSSFVIAIWRQNILALTYRRQIILMPKRISAETSAPKTERINVGTKTSETLFGALQISL